MRDKKSKYLYTIFTVLMLSGVASTAQEHNVHRPGQKWLKLAQDQFLQEHYRQSLKSVEQYLRQTGEANIPVTTSDERQQAGYLRSVAMLKLDLPGAADTTTKFLSLTTNPVYRQRASFALAQHYFRHEQLGKAIPYYESAAIGSLTNEEIADSKFELAYAYFNSRDFEKAQPLLATIKEVQGKYYAAGNYYYGLLAYNNGIYEDALTSFRRIENEPQYRNIVPYYIAEIYYFMGNRKKALEEATDLIRRNEKLYYDNELYLLAAQVLFEEQRYGEALPFFEHYYEHADKIRKEELYEMAYSYYRVNEWKNAIEKFKPLSNSQDSLGQTAMYLLGDCYLKTGDKKSARNAFGICADMPFNREQQEASLLLYGKLSYDMGFNDAAMRSFNTLISDFAGSQYINEARTLLSDLYVRTSQFEDAYLALKDVAPANSDFWRVQQKVNFGYAMVQLQKGDHHFADRLLDLSLRQPVDRQYETAAWFWKGDIAYRQGRKEDALRFLKLFTEQAENGRSYLSSQATEANAYLNLGYAAMDLQDYAAARSYFASAKENAADGTPIAINATVREADAAFMQKNYKEALALYDKIIAAETEESDYARLQKAILFGVQGKAAEKTALLQQIINKTPASAFANDARYELALTFIEDEQFQKAISLLQPLTESQDTRNYAAKALMRMGFAYQELKKQTQAIAAYQRIVTDFPGAEERTAALEALRSLYIETNQPEAYAAFLQTHNLPAAGSESLDATYYAAAEAQIALGKWAGAKTALTQYLDRYPNGAFATKASYYKGESHYQLKEYEAALAAFDVVLALPWNEFSEASAKRAADISFSTANYTAAAGYYRQLLKSAMGEEHLRLAYTGLMRSAYQSNDFEKAGSYADTLLTLPGLDGSVMHEVQLLKARALLHQKKHGEALSLYEQLKNVGNQAVAAEARYEVAGLYFLQGKLKEAETAAASSIELSAGSEYWVVRSYLLIADILVRQKDIFNAKATLQSLVKNTKDAGLKKEAAEKLAEVKLLEQQQSKLSD